MGIFERHPDVPRKMLAGRDESFQLQTASGNGSAACLVERASWYQSIIMPVHLGRPQKMCGRVHLDGCRKVDNQAGVDGGEETIK